MYFIAITVPYIYPEPIVLCRFNRFIVKMFIYWVARGIDKLGKFTARPA